MANTILTPTQVTRKALQILHQKLNFVGNVNRQYDDSFAKSGARIGDTLKVRLPNRYTVRSGATLSAQDTTEESVSLTVSNQMGVDVNFSSAELTLSLDDFAERILEPAMAVLAASIESDFMSVYKSVYQQVNNVGSAMTFTQLIKARKVLTDALAPTSQRSLLLGTQENADMVDALKGLFQDANAIKQQYREGLMGRTGGFDIYENTLLPRHTSGSDASGYLVNGANQTGSTLAIDTGLGTFNAGDIITIAGVYRVHPETKATTSDLQQFVVTADYAGGAGNLSISPAIVTSGPKQNVNASPADNAAITKVGGANVAYNVALAFHRDAFIFATADLVMPKGVDFAARETYDGISLRIVRQYDINNDKFPCRIDVLYGYVAARPELACRIANN